MDASKAWSDLSFAVARNDWVAAAEIADGLIQWLAKDGKPPKITGQPAFDKLVAKNACEAIAQWEIA
jgi:hypothetical protein